MTLDLRRALARVLATVPRRILVAAIAGFALIGAAGAAGQPFTDVSRSVQVLMSILVPLIGVLLAGDARRGGHPALPAVFAALMWAAGFGLAGVVVSAATVLVSGGGWAHAAPVAVASVLVQMLAQLVGTGMGMLLRPAAVAFAATIVAPLGLWLLLAFAPASRPWLTPFTASTNLLTGAVTGLECVQWAVTAAIWGVGLNLAGAANARRR